MPYSKACANCSLSKEARGKALLKNPEKDEVVGVGGEEALSKSAKHSSCDKSISVFNRVEKKCVEGVEAHG